MSEIHIIDECQDHNYFSLIPNIIYSIGLSSNQIAIYGAIKMVTGEKRDCVMCLKKLAKYAGMSLSTFIRCYPSLSEINSVLKMPLIIISKRIHENGDQDTNSIKIVNIWPQNMKLYCKEGGGHVNLTPPHGNLTPGVMSNCHQGGVKLTHKQEHLNKNNMNKNIPPSGSDVLKSGGWAEDKDFKKKLVDLLNTCKKLDLPFSDHGIYQAMKQSSPYAVQEMLKSFSQRPSKNRNLLVPDRWLLCESIKKHEIELIKKDYK